MKGKNSRTKIAAAVIFLCVLFAGGGWLYKRYSQNQKEHFIHLNTGAVEKIEILDSSSRTIAEITDEKELTQIVKGLNAMKVEKVKEFSSRMNLEQNVNLCLKTGDIERISFDTGRVLYDLVLYKVKQGEDYSAYFEKRAEKSHADSEREAE